MIQNRFFWLTLLLPFLPLFASAQPIFRGESVEYDYASKRWFTSDDGTSIIQRDSNSVISYFGTNLKASHGMEILGNTLFACEGSIIYGYDLTTELEVMQVTVPGAAFLNGLTNDGGNKLYATCFTNKKIFEIDVSSLIFPVVTEIVSATVSKPNGIVYDGQNQRLIFVNWGLNAEIKAVDLSGFAVSTLVSTAIGNIDGIDEDGLGHYYISSWSPVRISRYDTNFVGAPVTITAPGINNPADICYAKGIDTLGIPNGNGPVTFVGFGTTVANSPATKSTPKLKLYPNPVTSQSAFEFELPVATNAKLELMDAKGRIVKVLLAEQINEGKHIVLLTGIELKSGLYFARLRAHEEGRTEVLRFLVE